MSNQASFQVATLDLLRHLKSKKEAMQSRHASELSAIDNEIEAVSITVRLLRESTSVSEAVEQPKPSVIPNDLSGRSAREACIEIAKKNNGIVRVADAKSALVAAGILKDGKNSWAIVYTTMQRSKEFEKAAGTGTFRLIDAAGPMARQASLPQ